MNIFPYLVKNLFYFIPTKTKKAAAYDMQPIRNSLCYTFSYNAIVQIFLLQKEKSSN